jgi:hypothetical protein
MKNINVLPTDKPSRLYYHKSLKHYVLTNKIIKRAIEGVLNQNIYITSDEEIKEGDWYENNGVIFKADDVFDEGNNPNNSNPRVTDWNKKIILTTDQDLIKDGVQAIDNEFLEWFIKNPSCEVIKVEQEKYILQHLFKPQEYKFRYKINIPKKYKVMVVGSGNQSLGKALVDSMKSFSKKEGGLRNGETNLPIHKITIPKEELNMIECYFTPRKDISSATICSNCGQEKFLHTIGEGIKVSTYIVNAKKEPKQETLEEAAKEFFRKFKHTHSPDNYHLALVEFAKWQQERMYSEEDMKSAFKVGFSIGYGSDVYAIDEKNKTCEEWFNKIKKK